MRKGFILTLTALATAFLVTSAVALGPTVKPIPDVYIGNQAASGADAETGVNTFRYSEALILWDYVTKGVETGDGSTSDTLYWAWAAKAADFSGGTGAFLDTASTNYTIIQENAVEATQLQPPLSEVGAAGWVAEINNALTGLGSGLSDYSVGAAGALTFRDIRLSPLPEQAIYPAPTADTGAPAGTYGVQEATVYVSDTNTTPGTGTFLLVTVAGDSQDELSGGAVFSLIEDYSSDTSAWTVPDLSLAGVTNDAKAAPLIPVPNSSATNTQTGSISVTVPAVNSTGRFGYILSIAPWPAASVPQVETTNLYRVSVSVSSSNVAAASNPSALVSLNGRTTCGYSVNQMTEGQGPTQSSGPVELTAYLVPVATGTPNIGIDVYDADSTSNFGGTLTFSDIQVMSAPLADVLAGAGDPVQTIDTFDLTAAGAGTGWQPLLTGGVPFGGYTVPTFTQNPATGVGSAQVTIVTSTNTHAVPAVQANQLGFYSLDGVGDKFATTPGQLYLVAYTLSTSSAPSAVLPTTWLSAQEQFPGITAPNMLFQRPTDGTSGPTTTPAPYYLVFEATGSETELRLRLMADQSQISGNITMSQIDIYEADVPTEPAP